MSKDIFSQQASDYAKYRPSYPPELFDYIVQFVQSKDTAWDCATGNGQAAVALARHFKKVFASDLSEKQILLATPHPAITYSVSTAEKTSFDDNMFDLITVAQAYHWLDFDAFHREATRVARTGCIIAVWCYNIPKSGNEDIDQLVHKFYTQTVGPYWDRERRYIDEELRTVPFLFEELPPATHIYIEKKWSKQGLAGYLNSWSSVQHYMKANGNNPVDAFADSLSSLWKEDNALEFKFPLFMRIGRIIKR